MPMLPFLLLATASLVAAAARSSQASSLSAAESFQAASALRDARNPTWAQQQKAIEHLVAATGFQSREHGRRYPFNASSSGSLSQQLRGFGDSVNVSATPHAGALRELAKAFQDGHGVKLDFRLALELFRRAAELGDPGAQGEMAWRYTLGLDELTCWSQDSILCFGEPKPEEAMLHHFFAANGGDTASRMALGHRHLHGLGVPKSCWTAAAYYQPVADQVADMSAQEGLLPQIERIRLHMQSSGQGGMRSGRQKEVVQYFQYNADRGNTDAATAVGQVLSYGTHGVARNHQAALQYFKIAAAAGDTDAMAHLGHMYANGYGARRSYERALEWWGKAARHASAQFGLGYMYLTARGVSQDYDRAFQYFSKAVEQGNADAQFYMGVMHLRGYGVRRKSVQRAFSYFTLAALGGHTLAQYNAAMMHLGGKGTTKSCKPAVNLLKSLAEKGPAAAALQQGHEAFFRAQYGVSLVNYLRAAEMGMEVALSNAAWMLERGYVQGANASRAAFDLYRLSAQQGNTHSLLCLGDSYFYGRGVAQDWMRSSAVYYEAYQERSAEAMFNLGFMHEFGVGVPGDLALARRFYNMAKHTQADAWVPVYIANAWLSVHEVWDALRPMLPSNLNPLWNKVFAMHAPHTSVFGPWVAEAQGWLGLPSHALMHAEVVLRRWVDSVGISTLLSIDDGGESLVLAVLLIVLVVVVRLRRMRAGQRQQQVAAAAAGQDNNGRRAAAVGGAR